MLKLGEKAVIVADQYEQNLPVGEYGYIIAYDRNPDNVFDYVIRILRQTATFSFQGTMWSWRWSLPSRG